ncbi:ABC transporter ATP-binding protein/permease [Burkholderia sp. AU30198]|uniref:ATP-binding cassette domain-containing protein n=1 Tax=Burkholderia sp. AU30198 TaxID=2879627 RepID=UPI001CF30FB1|nr:ABC transporter ATP-binding protein [Burkholderia sp. AU30198]MCA8292778.1 ABC transporter ATP-binding protein/permease [Burkholderia sp. AU30198]
MRKVFLKKITQRPILEFIFTCLGELGFTKMIVAFVLTFIAAASALAFPAVCAYALRSANGRPDFLTASYIVAPLSIWSIAELTAGLINSTCLQHIRSISKRVLYRQTIRRGRIFFSTQSTGGLDSLINVASFSLRSLFADSFVNIVRTFAVVTVLAAFIANVSIKILIGFLGWSALFLCISVWLSRRNNTDIAAAVRSTSHVSAHVVDTFGNVEMIRLYGTELAEIARLDTLLKNESHIYDKSQRQIEVSSFMQRVIVISAAFASAIYFLYDARVGGESFAQIQVILFLIFFASIRIESFGRTYTASLEYIGKLKSSLSDLGYVMDDPESSSEQQASSSSGFDVEFKDVSFSYGENPTIRNLSVKIQQGEKIGIIGPSGGGKSTFVRLLVGVLSPESGEIHIGAKLRKEDGAGILTGKVVLLSQESQILHRSLRENLLYGVPEDRGDTTLLKEAVDFAGLNPLLDRLGGFDAVVGERGMAISGGERQRIALARAFLIEPTVLVLDEASSAIDIDSEREILRKVEERFAKSTVISIAHRSETLAYAHRVLVIRNGTVTADVPTSREDGTASLARFFDHEISAS